MARRDGNALGEQLAIEAGDGQARVPELGHVGQAQLDHVGPGWHARPGIHGTRPLF
jgi:hypothetical protein